MQVILAIDQGTTNTKALLLDRTGSVLARASRPVAVEFPQPGWVEQSAAAIWQSVTETVDECLLALPQARVQAAGITNQRETVVVWDSRSGAPVAPCLVWQCRRTADECDLLRRRGMEAVIQYKSGLALDPLFSASKIAWVLRHTPDGLARAADGQLRAGTVDSWILWNLTAGQQHGTDLSNASRTQLLDIRSCAWDPDLLRAFGVPAGCLAQLGESSQIHQVTAGTGRLPAGIPIAGIAGDSHAALFGHAAFVPGLVKATYGTGSSLMTLLPAPVTSQRGLSTTIAWSAGGTVRHALEGNITNTGGAVDWLAGFLGLPGGAREVAALARTVADSAGVYVVPAFAGLGAPHWDAGARGLIAGLTRGATAAHAARATIDAIAYQVADVFNAMCGDTGVTPTALLADGGASANDCLMQFQADVLDCPVVRNESTDVAAIGAAWLAGLATGFWSSPDELQQLPRLVRRFEPAMRASRREALLAGWADALARSTSRSMMPPGA